jgi:hypothetical protein
MPPRQPPLTRPNVTSIVPSDQTPGRSVSVGDFIVEQVRAGVDPNYAAGTVGVTAQELMAWMREGSLVFSRLNAGADWRRDFTREQKDCAVFADKALRAQSAHIARLAIIAEQVARGGATKTETRTKTVRGQVVEQTETVTTLLPDAGMLQWKLEKLAPTVYGSRATLNIAVTDLTDTDDEAETMERRMREVAAALAIDATSD